MDGFPGRRTGKTEPERDMTVDVDIPRDPMAPRRARCVIEDHDGTIEPALVPDITLLVSELVTNSVRHGAGDEVRLQIEAPAPTRVRVEVVDDGHSFIPTDRDRPATEPGGWGLPLVDQLADRWGIYEGSTHVWFEIDRS
jgi:two-component sensor histidine kinase